jgi:hypothetical protein
MFGAVGKEYYHPASPTPMVSRKVSKKKCDILPHSEPWDNPTTLAMSNTKKKRNHRCHTEPSFVR